MSDLIEEYLKKLKRELAGADTALVQDALSDAEEHLRTAAGHIVPGQGGRSESDQLVQVIDAYGAPGDVAAAYRDLETRTSPTLAPRLLPAAAGAEGTKGDDRSAVSRFFGVFVDPRSYASLFYMFFSLITGILYFTWAWTGLSLSAGFIVMIFGLPFILVFLLSIQGIGLVEGRIVEALLGVRMPRRPIFSKPHLGFWARLKTLATDKLSWTTLAYMVIQLPLGVLYFSIFVTMLAFGLSGMVYPLVQARLDLPMVQIDSWSYYPPAWLQPILFLVGVLWILLTMHAAKIVGRAHGAYAKRMLVRD